jgi:uncharacterized protein YwgA
MEKEDYLVAIYNFFHSRNVNLSKILLQKAMYALDFTKEETGFQFEAYHYGPFSKELGESLAELRGDEKITIKDNVITLSEESPMNREIPQDVTEKVAKVLTPFIDNVLEGKTDFNSVELNGTVMFVMDVLELAKDDGAIPDIAEVRNGIKRWKWMRFNDDEIKRAYARIGRYMWDFRDNVA